MRKPLFLAVIFCSANLCVAADMPSFNVKEGLWEETVTHSMSGMPAMPNIPPDKLAQMPPDQRARIEAMMNGGSAPDVHKSCVTKEKLQNHTAFSSARGDCNYNVVNSTASKIEVKVHCTEKQSTSDGTFKMETVDSNNVKGTMHMAVTTSSGRNMTMDMTIASKYLGPDCGDVK